MPLIKTCTPPPLSLLNNILNFKVIFHPALITCPPVRGGCTELHQTAERFVCRADEIYHVLNVLMCSCKERKNVNINCVFLASGREYRAEEIVGNDEDLQAQSVNLYLGAFYKETWNVDKGQH